MILESAQLLCSVHHVRFNFNGDIGFKLSANQLKKAKGNLDPRITYKLTHPNHPCAIWARTSIENYKYLLALSSALNKEYQYRYSKSHKSYEEVIKKLPDFYTTRTDLTDFALCMPDEYKTVDAVESYRKYYKGEKTHLASWKNREIPWWWNSEKNT